jgi:putative phosphoribosyl transferase
MSTPPLDSRRTVESVQIPVGARSLAGDLAVPAGVRGLVIFAHGSGSNRISPRNRHIADVLDRGELATLLVDLLTLEEEETDLRTGRLRFDMTLLASRLVAFCSWAQRVPKLRGLPVGLFGASTGGGAALLAAAQQPRSVRAVVARGGRPDLAGSAIRRVMAPTLLIVGERDEHVLDINRHAVERMLTEVRLEVVPGATHFFEEAGTLDQVGQLAADWFRERLALE